MPPQCSASRLQCATGALGTLSGDITFSRATTSPEKVFEAVQFALMVSWSSPIVVQGRSWEAGVTKFFKVEDLRLRPEFRPPWRLTLLMLDITMMLVGS
jgi:hypothetical protein